jgi:hypothetical protein
VRAAAVVVSQIGTYLNARTQRRGGGHKTDAAPRTPKAVTADMARLEIGLDVISSPSLAPPSLRAPLSPSCSCFLVLFFPSLRPHRTQRRPASNPIRPPARPSTGVDGSGDWSLLTFFFIPFSPRPACRESVHARTQPAERTCPATSRDRNRARTRPEQKHPTAPEAMT